MAQRVAIASGNWSNPAIWNGGVLPEPGDVVASNFFTVTIDQNINVDSITNAATTVSTEVPAMTSNTTPSGIASNSGTGGFASFSAYSSFDRSGGFLCYYPGPFTGDWIAYEFATAKKIGRFGVAFNGGSNTVSYSLEAWNGSTWIVIGTHTASGGFTYSPVFVNTTAYLKYRIVLSGTNTGLQLTEFYLYDALSLSATAGGTFILNDGVTVTCTGGGINLGAVTCLTYAGSGSSTINSNISGINANGITGITHSGTGTLTINGTINASTGASSTTTINVTAAAILNINGNVNGFSSSPGNANAIRMGTSGGVLNLVGNIEVRGTQKQTISMLAGTTLNMTGNILCQLSSANSGVGVDATSATINITGNLSITNATNVNNVNWYALYAANICTINVVGTISNDTTSNAMAFSYPVSIGGASYFNHVGSVIGGLRAPAFYNLVAGAINIMTGPFISDSSGTQPLWISRMHYRRTMGSYFEFRDNSTNGALPPAASAPATRLVSPDTIADSPIPANVRQGTSYAAGSQTGTMIVPSPSNVANNVPVDNTVGTAVLDPNAIWAVPLTSINTLNSIGRRVKNAATVETTGAQIQTTLNNNE